MDIFQLFSNSHVNIHNNTHQNKSYLETKNILGMPQGRSVPTYQKEGGNFNFYFKMGKWKDKLPCSKCEDFFENKTQLPSNIRGFVQYTHKHIPGSRAHTAQAQTWVCSTALWWQFKAVFSDKCTHARGFSLEIPTGQMSLWQHKKPRVTALLSCYRQASFLQGTLI